MDNIREKLMRLVCDALEDGCVGHCTYPHCLRVQSTADHLIANGVTVLPVQVGDTVYGRFRSYGKEVHQCEVVKVKACQFKDRTVRYFLDLEFYIIDPFFHDGRLMRCGMQAVYGADFGDWYRAYLTKEEAEAQPPKGVSEEALPVADEATERSVAVEKTEESASPKVLSGTANWR